jgi:putative FmdB family regulatory protein
MPLYDYQCLKCDQYFEVRCKIAERGDAKPCPWCGNNHTESRILSAPQVSADPIDGNQHRKAFREVLNKIHKKSPGSTLNKTTEL